LPRVLLIGDSISMGYTLPVRELLRGKANVHRPPLNCRSTRQSVERIDEYLGAGRWDVIHFNCGIHDLTLLDSTGKAASEADGGTVQVPLDEYRRNLEQIIARLKNTGATLIWATKQTEARSKFPSTSTAATWSRSSRG
jgi:acyl-CoA thioesterase-1